MKLKHWLFLRFAEFTVRIVRFEEELLGLNPSHPSRVLWKNLRAVEGAEDKLNSGPT
jgi:hypothetical protein